MRKLVLCALLGLIIVGCKKEEDDAVPPIPTAPAASGSSAGATPPAGNAPGAAAQPGASAAPGGLAGVQQGSKPTVLTPEGAAAPGTVPSGFPTALPSGFPTAMPSGFPSTMPSGFPTAWPTSIAVPSSIPIPPIPSASGTTTTKKP